MHSIDEFFHRKYEENEATGEIHQIANYDDVMRAEQEHADTHFHMPSPSYWPIILALALPIVAYGIIFNRLLAVFGGVLILFSMFGWSLEPSVADESDYDPPADGGISKELATVD